MTMSKIEIRFLYEKWPSWAIGVWLYKDWFGMQILPFKIVIMRIEEIIKF